jgi:uncharacterized protein YbjT (DUF2867 family)
LKILIFGATGMVGQGVVRECLHNPIVSEVYTIGRSPTKLRHPKIREIKHEDLWNYDSIESALKEFDACFFCLGVSSNGMKEIEYTRLTHDLTIAAATTLARLNPLMTFIYVSGDGTNSSESGSVMWARVKGKTENALLKLFKNAYMFRPGIIEPLNGAVSKTKSYRILYSLMKPFMPLIHKFFPKYITTTENVGRAMIAVTKSGYPQKILSNTDINLVGQKRP